ncbi:transcription factor SPEECHLESS [Iris pallida]|uniref:Transcription factor SPEECHLESS n=1 Tax=Iris pallida TaxID=29817 RepID=A0AAX6FZP0_IRIPA|nr:transcription factor SPEECHLESS [Iris pallida]KAJ6821820.1 transcription factor SPEECHLESS [Iris pallida]
MGDSLSDFFEDPGFGSSNFARAAAAEPENLFSILENLEEASRDILPLTPFDEPVFGQNEVEDDEPLALLSSQRSVSSNNVRRLEAEDEDEVCLSLRKKKIKLMETPSEDGQQKISHITVERNRRKQMNEHLTVLRSLMPCFYVKRGDQASIIGGVVDYIKELQQVLHSLEAKKQRKVYSEVLSPRPAASSSPRPPPLSPRPLPRSPRPLPLSPRIGLPISPRTPQPGSPYKPRMQQPPPPPYISPAVATSAASHDSSPSTTTSTLDSVAELAAAVSSKSPLADVQVKFSGPNVILKTVSHRIPGQALKIIAALEDHCLEILHVSISTTDDTMLNSFTIKIGIECELSAEELAQEIQQTFS